MKEKIADLCKIAAIVLVFVAALLVLFVSGLCTPTTFCNAVRVSSTFIPLVYLLYIYTSKKITRGEAVRILLFLLYPIGVKVNPMWLMIFYAMVIWGG